MAHLFRAAAAMTIAGWALAASTASVRAQSTAPMPVPGQSAATAAGASAAPLPSPSAGPFPSPSPAPDPSPSAAPENPLVTARVRREFTNWQRGRIDRATYSPYAGGTYINAFVNVVSPDLIAIGPLQTVAYRSASLLLGDVVYRYDITGALGAVSALYSLDARGKTDGIVFTPLIFRAAPAVP